MKPLRVSSFLKGILVLISCCYGVHAHAGCLMKEVAVTDQLTAHTFMIAPRSETAAYLAQGFRVIDCPGDLKLVRAYIEQICATSSSASAPPINTDAVLGVSRPRACADAKAGLAEITGNNPGKASAP